MHCCGQCRQERVICKICSKCWHCHPWWRGIHRFQPEFCHYDDLYYGAA